MCKFSLFLGLPLLALSASLLQVESRASWFSEELALALVDDGSQAQIEAVGRSVRDRLNQRRAITAQVLARQLPLLDAATQFYALSRVAPDRPLERLDIMEGDSLGEKLCNQVLRWAEAQAVELPPSQSRAVLAELNNEFAELLRQGNGKIVLPEL